VSGVHVIVPFGVDDPTRPSGGNAYDRHVCNGLAASGWSVREHVVPGTWPRPDAASFAALADVMRHIPDGAVVIPGEYLEVVVPSSDQKFHASLPFTAWSSTALANWPR